MLKLKQVQEKSREHESENEQLGVITLKIQNGGQKTFWPKGKQQISKYCENIKYSSKVEKIIISEGLLFLAEGVYCYLLSNSSAVYNKEVQSREVKKKYKEECQLTQITMYSDYMYLELCGSKRCPYFSPQRGLGEGGVSKAKNFKEI